MLRHVEHQRCEMDVRAVFALLFPDRVRPRPLGEGMPVLRESNAAVTPEGGVIRRLFLCSVVLAFGTGLVGSATAWLQVCGALCLLCFPLLMFNVVMRALNVLAAQVRKQELAPGALNEHRITFFTQLLADKMIDQREFDFIMRIMRRTDPL